MAPFSALWGRSIHHHKAGCVSRLRSLLLERLPSSIYVLHQQFALEDHYRLALQKHSITFHLQPDGAAAFGGLIAGQRRCAELLSPEVGKAAMSRTCDGIFVDSGCRCEEPRDKIVWGSVICLCCDDDASAVARNQASKVNFQTTNNVFC